MARLKDVDRFPAKYPGVDHLVDGAQGQHQYTCQTELQLVPKLFYPACWSPYSVPKKCHVPNYLQLLPLCLNSFRLFNAQYFCIPYIVSQRIFIY
jgi:hypothetical protein